MNSVGTKTAADRWQPQLGDVQETLLIPLYFRARETARPDAIVRDPHAVRIVAALDYNFSRFDDATNVALDCIIRSEIFDEQVMRFMSDHPGAVVVNLGAGLDARFLRLDDGHVRWFDLDMPDAIQLRQYFLPDGPRNRSIACSMFDPAWLDQVDAPAGTPILMIAEGLFCYFQEQQIRDLLVMLANRWPGVRVLFQSISPRYVQRDRSIPAVNKTRAKLLWGIEDGRQIESWDARYRYLDQWSLIDRHRRRWGRLRWLSWLPWVRSDLRKVMKVSLVQLDEPANAPKLLASAGSTR
jgi:O-methyltransferase involved in polyketide biosynthesis